MTDKQIIIDGVDVSGCIYFFDGYCNDNNDGFKCSLNSEHCYYKQLKAKEQECEELKEGYAELTDIVAPYMDDFTGYNEELGGFDIVLCVKEFMEQLQAKEQECKRLKLDLIEAKAHGDYLNNLALSETLNLVSKEFDQLKADYKQLEITCEDFKKCINKQRNAKIQLSKLKDKQYKEFCDMKQTLSDIKSVLEFYSNSKIGVEQPNGTYSMEIKDDKVIGGKYTITYNPNLAKTALDKINKVI